MNTNSLGTDKHTFMDIFQATFDNDGESVVLQKIVIPIIQRDYAQGRDEKEKDGPVLMLRGRSLRWMGNRDLQRFSCCIGMSQKRNIYPKQSMSSLIISAMRLDIAPETSATTCFRLIRSSLLPKTGH